MAISLNVCREGIRVAIFVLASFHLHLLCDRIGARGPDSDAWPIPYFAPFTQAHAWQWSGQWALNGWQNFAITGGLIALSLWVAIFRGHSFVELFSRRADALFVGTLRQRFRPEMRD